MSRQTAMEWALTVPTDTLSQRLILMALVLNADHEAKVTMTATDLARIAMMQVRPLRANVARMERMGIIRKTDCGQSGTTYEIIGALPFLATAQTPINNDIPLIAVSEAFDGGGYDPEIRGGSDRDVTPRAREGDIILTSLPILPVTTKKNKTPPSPLPAVLAKPPKILPSSPAKSIQPNRVLKPGQPTDLLGLPLGDDPEQLLRTAVETWHYWQGQIPDMKQKNIKRTALRRRRFLAAWKGPLNSNMTHWRKLCQSCTQNAFLAGKEGRWDGASFDWVMKVRNVERILSGEFTKDYIPAEIKYEGRAQA